METISFDKLLLQTAFCCMASDGNIDEREVALIQSMCEKSGLFENFNFQEEINQLVNELNAIGTVFIQQYFNTLKATELSEQEQLILIDFAIQTINADEVVEYSEIKFFKNIRHRLNISDDIILEKFPDIEDWLEQDIITDSFLENITSQFLNTTVLPQFDLISIDKNTPDNSDKQ